MRDTNGHALLFVPWDNQSGDASDHALHICRIVRAGLSCSYISDKVDRWVEESHVGSDLRHTGRLVFHAMGIDHRSAGRWISW